MSGRGGSGHRICSVAYTHYRSDPRVRREAQALADRGDSVTVIALREPGRRPLDVVDGVRVIGYPLARYRGQGVLPYVTGYSRFIARAAAHMARRAREYDLIHVHTLPEALIFAAAVPKISGRPVLLDVHDLSTEVFASRHGGAPAPVRIAERLSLRFADHILTVHDDYLDRIHQRGIPRDDISVVLNTPDDRLFHLAPPRPPTRPPRLIYHGTFVARYGLAVALHAVAAVSHRLPGIRLDLVGDGDFRPEIVRLVGELGLDGCVEVSAGTVPLDEIPTRIEAADIGLVPMIDDPFTRAVLPTKLLEYVSAGIPVIVSRNPVIERYFTDDDVFFVQPGDAEGVAAAIERISDDPAGAAQRAQRAQRFFAEEGWPIAKKRFLAVIDEMIDR